MRTHALDASDGLVYSEMGRFQAAAEPDNPAGTSDPEAAVLDDDGNPVANPARNTWVTQTALATALNQAYFGERVAFFGVVVGIALLLAGIGFVVLSRRRRPAPSSRAGVGSGTRRAGGRREPGADDHPLTGHPIREERAPLRGPFRSRAHISRRARPRGGRRAPVTARRRPASASRRRAEPPRRREEPEGPRSIPAPGTEAGPPRCPRCGSA